MTTVISDYMNDPQSYPFSQQYALVYQLLFDGRDDELIGDIVRCVTVFGQSIEAQFERAADVQQFCQVFKECDEFQHRLLEMTNVIDKYMEIENKSHYTELIMYKEFGRIFKRFEDRVLSEITLDPKVIEQVGYCVDKIRTAQLKAESCDSVTSLVALRLQNLADKQLSQIYDCPGLQTLLDHLLFASRQCRLPTKSFIAIRQTVITAVLNDKDWQAQLVKDFSDSVDFYLKQSNASIHTFSTGSLQYQVSAPSEFRIPKFIVQLISLGDDKQAQTNLEQQLQSSLVKKATQLRNVTKFIDFPAQLQTLLQFCDELLLWKPSFISSLKNALNIRNSQYISQFVLNSILADQFFAINLLEFSDIEFLARQFVFTCLHANTEQLERLKHFSEQVGDEFIADLGFFLKQAATAIATKTMKVSQQVLDMAQYQVEPIQNAKMLPYGSCRCIIDGAQVDVEPHLVFLIEKAGKEELEEQDSKQVSASYARWVQDGRPEVLTTIPADTITQAEQSATPVTQSVTVDDTTAKDIVKAKICAFLKLQQQASFEEVQLKFSSTGAQTISQLVNELVQNCYIEVINDTLVWSE